MSPDLVGQLGDMTYTFASVSACPVSVSVHLSQSVGLTPQSARQRRTLTNISAHTWTGSDASLLA